MTSPIPAPASAAVMGHLTEHTTPPRPVAHRASASPGMAPAFSSSSVSVLSLGGSASGPFEKPGASLAAPPAAIAVSVGTVARSCMSTHRLTRHSSFPDPSIPMVRQFSCSDDAALGLPDGVLHRVRSVETERGVSAASLRSGSGGGSALTVVSPAADLGAAAHVPSQSHPARSDEVDTSKILDTRRFERALDVTRKKYGSIFDGVPVEKDPLFCFGLSRKAAPLPKPMSPDQKAAYQKAHAAVFAANVAAAHAGPEGLLNVRFDKDPLWGGVTKRV